MNRLYHIPYAYFHPYLVGFILCILLLGTIHVTYTYLTLAVVNIRTHTCACVCTHTP